MDASHPTQGRRGTPPDGSGVVRAAPARRSSRARRGTRHRPRESGSPVEDGLRLLAALGADGTDRPAGRRGRAYPPSAVYSGTRVDGYRGFGMADAPARLAAQHAPAPSPVRD